MCRRVPCTSSRRHGPFAPRLLFPSNARMQHHVGPEETGDGAWSLDLGAGLLGRIDERTTKVHG
jgi:hypothetical protein